MSDFVFSRIPKAQGSLSVAIQAIYHEEKPTVTEYHGSWGSLAVSESLYDGYRPLETDDHICVVVGGPVLYFEHPHEQAEDQEVSGTKAILQRWIEGRLRFDEEISGPYTLLIVNKKTEEVTLVTDMMSFIPCYCYEEKDNVSLSTHVDVLARVVNQSHDIDTVSLVDFILHSVVTYPYTMYRGIRQVRPASVYSLPVHTMQLKSRAYWTPVEQHSYRSMKKAASALRDSLRRYISAVTKKISKAALFISAGEDSRTIAALLPRNIKRDGFVFLDRMNREGAIASKVAEAYGVQFHVKLRQPTHYLDILPACHELVGSGAQYHHVHTLGFHKTCHLHEYPAVFGGLLSDALLKGSRIKKLKGSGRMPFLPQIKRYAYRPAKPIKSQLFKDDILSQLTERRKSHLHYVKSFRKKSAEEWFELWPISMNLCIPNIHGNRRLFSSYEPFTDVHVVKISASIPQSWKLNRRLFQRTAKPLLRPTKWMLHGEGRLPYFPWYVNVVVQFVMWSIHQLATKLRVSEKNQGPWGEFDALLESEVWRTYLMKYGDGLAVIRDVLKSADEKSIARLNPIQKLNLMQVLYSQSETGKKHVTEKQAM